MLSRRSVFGAAFLLVLLAGALAVFWCFSEECEGWLGGGDRGESLAVAGEQLYRQLGCEACHGGQSGARGPALVSLYGSEVQLRSGAAVVADEGYLRDAIMNPGAQVVAGYDVLMPVYQGTITEEGLLELIAYIRSLGAGEAERAGGAGQKREQ